MEVDLTGIHRELSRMTCSEHHKGAELNINEQSIESKTCCENFANEVNSAYVSLLTEEVRRTTIQSLTQQ